MGVPVYLFKYVFLGNPHALFPNRLILFVVCAASRRAPLKLPLRPRDGNPLFWFLQGFPVLLFLFFFSLFFFNPGEDS